MLGVHENTIRNRIRQAEDLLATPLVNRRTELQVALRLERVLQADSASTGAFARSDSRRLLGISGEAAAEPGGAPLLGDGTDHQ